MAYTVKAGDTLYGLYGANWKTLSGYTGDPTKLQIGTQLLDLPGTTGGSLDSITNGLRGIQTQANQVQSTINAGDIQSTSALTIPPSSVETPSINDAAGSTSALEKLTQDYLDQAKALKEQITTLQTSQPTQQSWLDKISGTNASTPDVSTYVQQYNDVMAKVYPNQVADIAEVKTLQDQYNKDLAARDAALANIDNQSMPQSILTGKREAYEKQANIRLNLEAANINTKVGMINLAQGNADKAVSFIDKAIDNYTAEKKYEYQQYVDFMQYNQTQINNLDTKYQNILENGMNLAKMAYDEQVAEKKSVRDLMLNYPSAGITLEDTVDSATQKATRWGATNPTTSTNTPASYDEFVLAGGEKGMGMSYADWLKGGSKISANQEEAITTEMANLNTFKTRDEVFQYLDKNNTYFRRTMGEAGYVQLREAAENMFPKPTIAEEKATKIGTNLDKGLNFVINPQYNPLLAGYNVASTFFGNLFK